MDTIMFETMFGPMSINVHTAISQLYNGKYVVVQVITGNTVNNTVYTIKKLKSKYATVEFSRMCTYIIHTVNHIYKIRLRVRCNIICGVIVSISNEVIGVQSML